MSGNINRKLLLLTTALAASAALPAHAAEVFNRIATFPVSQNLPADVDAATPTSVAVLGGKVLAGVNTSKNRQEPSGNLTVIDLASKKIEASCDLGGQPDSVALSKDGKLLAIAIENERDEELNDGALPQLPAGNLKIVTLNDGAPDCASVKTVDLTGIAAVSPEDPEPEFVAFNDKGEIAVTLQENNHIAIVDAAGGKVVSHFPAGEVTLENVDTRKDGALSFTGKVENAPREPDAVKWLDDQRLVVANEGDYKGGARGFTIFSRTGEVLYESGPAFEYQAAAAGHYPDARNKKGIEPEGLEFASFGDQKLIFVAAERASLVGVYKDTGAEPEFLQLLPSGIGPEGLVAIPQRKLLVTANETDLVEDGLARSHIMVYELGEGTPAYPQIVSNFKDDGTPLGWGALSGLAADPKEAGKLYAVSDSVYRSAPAIFTIDTTKTPALITDKTVVTRDGQPAQKLDLEGLVADGKGGFWLASEGRSDKLTPHAIYNVNAKGEIKEEIAFPAELLAGETRFGLEGIAIVGEGDDLTLVMAVQREWADDPKGQVKLLAYKPKAKEWSAVRYPLEATEKGWVGLSEISAHDGKLYIVERDNLIGQEARNKRVYAVALDGFKPVKLGGDLPVVDKSLVRDLLPDLKSAANGYVVDKVEGFAIDASGEAFVVTDNDGVDDSSGETLFLRLGNIAAIN
ncbi:esterase-like activity of phytase family protein [Aminobacter aganoensis]|uniref:Phytase-like domain-containing protein n=1 Tax=Aminobacter aganoensis TaxID=83264 RepID=A0A7X0KP17_9HYPH|nr:esterase-like activity of phytase family protein [Aminobacter aganoensis]MBB6357762.1 hypothetical protein [Aminobacter aganoensis]